MPDEAIEFGEVILLSIPFVDLPEFGWTKRAALGEKTVLETANRHPERDGAMAEDVRQSGRGTGLYLREWQSHSLRESHHSFVFKNLDLSGSRASLAALYLPDHNIRM